MTNKISIRVQKLYKRYRIGLEEEIHDTLAGALTSFVASPIRNFWRLRYLLTFSENSKDSTFKCSTVQLTNISMPNTPSCKIY